MDTTRKNPFVSVIVAVKNGERYLGEALESILGQSYRPFEIIVIDGQSVDATESIARRVEGLRFIRQIGQGIADAYNMGIAAANGELIAFLSADDVWDQDKLSLQVRAMMDNPEIQYTVGKVTFFLHPGCAIPKGFRAELLEGEHVARIMETLLVRKTLFQRTGLFRTDLAIGEDVDWYARCKDMDIPMAVIPQVVLHKRVHDANASMDTSVNNPILLRVLRDSIARQRSGRQNQNVPPASDDGDTGS
jgi:glycosyltransferase involved in cell wall biosynthesis